jgi:hypothetical protein
MSTGRGTQFDAVVLDAFLSGLNENRPASVRERAVA